jgi:hypothetical protein
MSKTIRMTRKKPIRFVANIEKYSSSKTLWKCECGHEFRTGSQFTHMVLCHCGKTMKKIGEDLSGTGFDSNKLKEAVKKRK